MKASLPESEELNIEQEVLWLASAELFPFHL